MSAVPVMSAVPEETENCKLNPSTRETTFITEDCINGIVLMVL